MYLNQLLWICHRHTVSGMQAPVDYNKKVQVFYISLLPANCYLDFLQSGTSSPTILALHKLFLCLYAFGSALTSGDCLEKSLNFHAKY